MVDNNKNDDNNWEGNCGMVSQLLSVPLKSFRMFLAPASVLGTGSLFVLKRGEQRLVTPDVASLEARQSAPSNIFRGPKRGLSVAP